MALNPKQTAMDLAGQRFGRWVVLHKDAKSRHWLCRCDCGIEKPVFYASLLKGLSKSCGCSLVLHGHARQGAISITFSSWCSLHSRCYYEGDASYKCYGAKGITVCKRWFEFANFLADMGERPNRTYTIERRNNSLGYSPENCKWATKKEQARHRTNNTLLTFKDQTLTQVEWAELTGLSTNMIHKRLSRGWSIEDALTVSAKTPWAKPHAM